MPDFEPGHGVDATTTAESAGKPEADCARCFGPWLYCIKDVAETGAYLITIVGVFFLLWQSSMMRDTLRLTSDSLDATRESLAATNRAYVNVTGLDLIAPGPENAKRADVIALVRNTGETPTRTLSWQTASSTSRSTEAPATRVELDLAATASRGILAAEEENRRLIQVGSLEEEQIADIRMGRLRIAYFGAVIYKDLFTTDPHLTRFCYEIVTGPDHSPPPGLSYAPCQSNSNCTDADCGEKDLAFLAALR